MQQILAQKKSLGNFNFMQVKLFSPLPKEYTAFNLLSPLMATGEKRANYMKAFLSLIKCASRAVGRQLTGCGRTSPIQ